MATNSQLSQDALDAIAESTLEELQDMYKDASRILWDRAYCKKMGLQWEGKAWQLQKEWVGLMRKRLQELQRPTLEQAIAARDADFWAYAPIACEWEIVSDEDADKEWTDMSLTTHTFRLVNRDKVLSERQRLARTIGEGLEEDIFIPEFEICLVSYGFNEDKTAATCYAS